MPLAYMICLTCFAFSSDHKFDATLFCGHFNSNRFLYPNVIVILMNYVVCGTFPLLVYTVIQLGHIIKYENCEAVNTTK